MMRDGRSSLGVYVSVPFCRAKCSFCNFASGVGSAEAIEAYLETLFAEIDGARDLAARCGLALPEAVDSVYFGGGTPSLLSAAQISELMHRLRQQFRFTGEVEVTLEAAPGQIEDAMLAAAMEAGVNRVSLGVQSLVDREAAAVGRSHTGESCLREFERLRASGIRDVGADLICGLPYQTEESFAASLARAASGGLTHLSVYMLEVDEGSRLGREVLGGGARLHAPAVASEETVARMYEHACDVLPEIGFGQYEISNFSSKGFGSRHNLKYWMRSPYLGLGLDAHSMLYAAKGEGFGVRWQNGAVLDGYLRGEPQEAPVTLSERDAFEECVFLGLRLNEGLQRETVADFPKVWEQELDLVAGRLAEEGMMCVDAAGWRLTLRGRLVSSEVFGELLCGSEAAMAL